MSKKRKHPRKKQPPLIMDTPKFQEWAREVSKNLPLHVRDQVDAASEHTVRMMQHMSEELGQNIALQTPENISQGMRKSLDQYAEWVRAGKLRPCKHLKKDAPQTTALVISLAYKLDAAPITCLVCTTKFMELLAQDDVEDKTCDGCRTYSPDGLWSQVTGIGPVLVMGGYCDECNKVEGE